MEVAAPEVSGEIEFIRGGDDDDPFRVGETFGVRLTLDASEGLGDLTLSFDPTLDTWLEEQELLEVNLDELPELPEEFVLEPEGSIQFIWEVKAIAAGDFELATTVTATDAADRKAAPLPVTATGTVDGLVLTITPDPKLLNLNQEDDAANRIAVTVTVTNGTKDPVERVVLAGGMDALTLTGMPDDDGVPRLVVKIVEYPQRLDPTQSAVPDDLDHDGIAPEEDLELGDLQPGESASAVWVLEGFLPDDLEEGGTRLRALGHGVVEGERVDFMGDAEVRVVSDVLLEFGMLPDRSQVLSGQTVRFSGVVRNLSEEVTLGFAAVPVLDGNAGNGHVFQAGVGGMTPVSPLAFQLAPEQTVDLAAVLATIPSAVASEARIEWIVMAVRLDEDSDQPKRLTAGQIRVPEVAEGQPEYDTEFRISVAPSEWLQPGPDCGVSWFACSAVEAFDQLMTDIPHMAAWVWSVTDYSILARMGQFLGALSAAAQEGLNGNDEVMAQIMAEVIVQVYDEHMAAVEAGLALPETADGLMQAIGAAAGEWTMRIATAVETGDLETLQAEMGTFVGGNPDLAFAPVAFGSRFVARLASNVHSANSSANRALRRAEQARQASLAQRLDDAAAAGRKLETAVHVGDKLTLPLLQRVWGASPRNMRRLMEIAESHEVIIVFRSRWPRAAEMIERGLARAKPELFKMKSVNEVDVRYLGYPDGSEGLIRVIEPPKQINPNLTGDALAVNVENYIDTVLATSRPELARTPGQLNEAREVVRKRLIQRTEEWAEFALPNPNDPEGLSKLLAWEKRGVDTTFDTTTQGLPGGAFAEDIRNVELGRTHVGPAGPDARQVYEVKLGGKRGTPDANNFLDVTGDLDIVGILNKAGGFITDENQRLAVYKVLSELLDMQHGETLSLLRRDLQVNWMKGLVDGPNAERLVAVNPNRDVRAATLAETLAVTGDSPNARLRAADPTGDYILLQGSAMDVVARQGATRALTRRTWAGVLQDFYRNWTKFLPGRIINLLTGAPQSAQSDQFTREESIVLRPRDGALERWSQENGWQPVTIQDAIDLGDPDTLDMSPITMTSEVVEAGSSVIPILELVDLAMSQTSVFFQAGDLIAIAPGTDREELRRIAGFGSLILDEPLDFDHDMGTAIVLVEPAGGWPEESTTDTDTDQTVGAPDGGSTDEGALAQTGLDLSRLVSLALMLLIAGLFATRVPVHGQLAPSQRIRWRLRRW